MANDLKKFFDHKSIKVQLEMARGLQNYCDEHPEALKAKELLNHMYKKINDPPTTHPKN